MVKFGKNKFRALNKIAKKQKADTGSIPNKILKRKINANKKISFQKQVLLKEAINVNSPLVENISRKEVIEDQKNVPSKNVKVSKPEGRIPKPKPVKKRKQRQKTQINDTKLLLTLMKK